MIYLCTVRNRLKTSVNLADILQEVDQRNVQRQEARYLLYCKYVPVEETTAQTNEGSGCQP